MSIEAMNWAMWQQRTADPVARHVLWALANYANEDGKGAFCSVETIECITRLGERTIRRKLDDLQASGLIRHGNPAIAAAYIDRADRRPQVFDLDLGEVPQRRDAVLLLREQKRGAAEAGRDERGAALTGTGCRSDRNGVPLSHERGAAPAPKPSITHPRNHQGNRQERAPRQKPKASGFVLPDWIDSEAWQSYEAVRVRIRKPMTDAARVLAVRALEKLQAQGHSPRDVLEQSVFNGWQGLFAIKPDFAVSRGSAPANGEDTTLEAMRKYGIGLGGGNVIDMED